MEDTEYEQLVGSRGTFNRWFYPAISIFFIGFSIWQLWTAVGIVDTPLHGEPRSGLWKFALFVPALLTALLAIYCLWRLPQTYRIHVVPSSLPVASKLAVVAAFFARTDTQDVTVEGNYVRVVRDMRNWYTMETLILVDDSSYRFTTRPIGWTWRPDSIISRIVLPWLPRREPKLIRDDTGIMDFGTSGRAIRRLKKYLENSEGKGAAGPQE